MELTLIIIGLILLTYMAYTFVLRKRSTTIIPGPMGIPLIGSAFRINPRIMHIQLHELASKYGKIFELTFFHKKAVVLNDVELIEKAFARDGEYFNDRPSTFLVEELNFSQSVGGRSLNEDYRFARKAFTKGIHLYGSGIQKFESVVSGELKRLVKEIGDFEGGEFEVTQMFKRSVLNVMSILLIGTEATDEDADAVFNYLAGIQFFLTPLNTVVLSLFPFLKHLPVYKRQLDKLKESQKSIFDRYFYQTKVFANSWYIQHDENIWGDPWNFRPERFIGEDGNIVPNDHTLKKNLLTFGVGVRRCPGISIATSRIFLYIAYIFQRYTFEAVPGKFRSCDPRTDDFELSITLVAKPFYCRAKRRHGQNTQCFKDNQ